MGSRYLGGFKVGADDVFQRWLWETTKLWEEAVVDIASAAPNFLHAASSGLQKSLQQ